MFIIVLWKYMYCFYCLFYEDEIEYLKLLYVLFYCWKLVLKCILCVKVYLLLSLYGIKLFKNIKWSIVMNISKKLVLYMKNRDKIYVMFSFRVVVGKIVLIEEFLVYGKLILV